MTIEELAQKLGVSKSTVSRALSGKGRISEETRLNVQGRQECGQSNRRRHTARRIWG